VPVIYVNENVEGIQMKDGILEDIAPTLLHAMDLPIPSIMTGKVLITKT